VLLVLIYVFIYTRIYHISKNNPILLFILSRVRYDREPKDILHVDDISHRTRYVDKTERRTDLMNPIYQVYIYLHV
jgi:hypothetical protein